MIKLRHATRSFSFKKPGEVFEVYDKDVDKYVDGYGCELVDPPKPKSTEILKELKPAMDRLKKDEEAMESLRAEDAELDNAVGDGLGVIPPVQSSPGWWLYEGKKYRLKNLPAEAAALLE